MNEVELLVHGRKVTLEQQKAVHARVIWYVPCTCNRSLFQTAINAKRHDVAMKVKNNYLDTIKYHVACYWENKLGHVRLLNYS